MTRAMADGSSPACCASPKHASAPTGDEREADFLAAALAVSPATDTIRKSLRESLAPVPGGIFEMGARKSTFPDDHDAPRRKVRLDPFLIAPCAVTNAEFSAFSQQTGYRTVAEQEGWSFVFYLLLQEESAWRQNPPGLPWWRKVDGACWSCPEGPGSNLVGRERHPVVHIAWYDAIAYTVWAGLSLPTEAQWERAARGGLAKRKFPWGNEMTPNGEHAMNTFQGTFPIYNSGEDGWASTAPVDSYAPNAYGMFNMTGNVWEWVQDYFGPRPLPSRMPQRNPEGPAQGHARVQRGGSYLCHESYCDRYHVHSRTRNDPDSSTGNCGFRVAGPSPPTDANCRGSGRCNNSARGGFVW